MIEITKPNFIAGDEQRFSNFISKLNDGEKIALISHTSDLDGIASAKIVCDLIKPEVIKFIGYHDFNDSLIEVLKKNNIKFVIVTDLYIKRKEFLKEIEKFAEILIIDHHLFDEDWNSERTVFMNGRGNCATYLSYYLFSKIKNIEKHDWLVASACISDFCYTENADWMKKVYEKYGQTYNPTVEGIKESEFFEIADKITYSLIYSGNDGSKIFPEIGEEFGEIGELEKISKIIKAEIEREKDKFFKNKNIVNGRYYFIVESEYPLSSYVCTALSTKEADKTFIIGQRKNNIYKFSFRRQDRKENVDELSKKLVKDLENSDGGGHFAAAGASILVKDKEEFEKRLKNL